MVFEDVEVEMEVFYWVESQIFGKGKCNVQPFESNHHSKNSLTPFFYVSLDTSTQINRKKKAYRLNVLHGTGYEIIKHLKQSLICFAHLANESTNSKILVFLLAQNLPSF